MQSMQQILGTGYCEMDDGYLHPPQDFKTG
jgi:hypothetical protein